MDIEEITPSFRVGSVIFLTDELKMALITETRRWKMAYAKALNEKVSYWDLNQCDYSQ